MKRNEAYRNMLKELGITTASKKELVGDLLDCIGCALFIFALYGALWMFFG